MGRPDQPPVTGQFTYRPATNPDGTSPQPGWDLVWVSPRAGHYAGHEHTAKILDCWYPASYTRAVREHLGRAQPPNELTQPAATNLHGAHVEFTSPDEAYADLSNALLASRLKSSADGYQFEQQEIWSDRGDLLVDAQIVRRQERPQWPAPPRGDHDQAISDASRPIIAADGMGSDCPETPARGPSRRRLPSLSEMAGDGPLVAACGHVAMATNRRYPLAGTRCRGKTTGERRSGDRGRGGPRSSPRMSNKGCAPTRSFGVLSDSGPRLAWASAAPTS